MALEMRVKCGRCGKKLSASSVAYICFHECTYCDDCALRLQFTCQNCQGELVRRPKRRKEPTASDCAPAAK